MVAMFLLIAWEVAFITMFGCLIVRFNELEAKDVSLPAVFQFVFIFLITRFAVYPFLR